MEMAAEAGGDSGIHGPVIIPKAAKPTMTIEDHVVVVVVVAAAAAAVAVAAGERCSENPLPRKTILSQSLPASA